LIAGYFDCRELGFTTSGASRSRWRSTTVLHESGARTRLDVAARRGLPPCRVATTNWPHWPTAGAGQGRSGQRRPRGGRAGYR
jgi:hypothetical protein